MGTRSFVGVQKGDLIEAVYVHWDGYLAGVGVDLQKYTTQEQVEELISHGDRSSLEDEFYKDRGEAWERVKPETYNTFDEFFAACEDSWGEFYYIFKDGVWYYGKTYSGSPLHRKLVPVKQAMILD